MNNDIGSDPSTFKNILNFRFYHLWLFFDSIYGNTF